MVSLWAESIPWLWNNLILSDWLIWKGFPFQSILGTCHKCREACKLLHILTCRQGAICFSRTGPGIFKRKRRVKYLLGWASLSAFLLPGCRPPQLPPEVGYIYHLVLLLSFLAVDMVTLCCWVLSPVFIGCCCLFLDLEFMPSLDCLSLLGQAHFSLVAFDEVTFTVL